jgi:hypothetical protein
MNLHILGNNYIIINQTVIFCDLISIIIIFEGDRRFLLIYVQRLWLSILPDRRTGGMLKDLRLSGGENQRGIEKKGEEEIAIHHEVLDR